MSLGYVNYNGVPVSTETPLGIELMKWERKPDYRPENNPYPAMLYKAVKGSDGIAVCLEDEPDPYMYKDMSLHQRAIDRIRAINESRTMTVHTPEAHRKARENGWRDSAKEAIDQIHAYEHDMQQAAAERAYADRNMSESAKREIAKAERETDEQLASVPESRTLKNFDNPGRSNVKIDGRSKAGRAAREAAKAVA